MKHLLLPLLLTLSLGTQAQLPPAYTAKLQTTLDSLCASEHVKGASAAIIVPGMGTWKGVHGISEVGVPITPGMLFGLGSNTKTYIAALMLKLQEEGALSLNDTIGKWIHNKPNINGQITIRQMLNHTSGIYSYTDTAAFTDSIIKDFARIWTPDDMLQFVGKQTFAPGTSWNYSNTNYLLAGMIAAQVTGKPVQQALREKILIPASLTKTWMYPVETPTGIIPHVWFYDNGTVVDGNIAYGYQHESFLSAANSAGALISTAEDNAMFWRKLMSGQILNPASMAEFTQTVRLNSAVGYGLGVFRYRNINNHVVYEHGGTGFGFINENLADSLTGVTISLLSNQDSTDNNDLFDIVTALHKITLAPPTAIARIQASTITINLFPNPAKETLQITWTSTAASSAQALPYTITNATGRSIQTGILSTKQSTLNTASLPNGTYYLKAESLSKQFTILH
jgi:D-alanyl-D-alanine carboxypeptidase